MYEKPMHSMLMNIKTILNASSKLADLYCSPTIVGVIKSRKMRWEGYVACVEGERRVQGFGGKT
jgi:hypothetical protein